jgi:hypothetical protein
MKLPRGQRAFAAWFARSVARTIKRLARLGDRDFSWKLRWRIRHDRNPLLVRVQDKLAVKSYAAARGVSTARLLHATGDPATIPFDHLPTDCFIKAAHGCAWNIRIVATQAYLFHQGNELVAGDGSLFTGRAMDHARLSREECVALCRQWLATSYTPRLWVYRRLPRRIIVEETLESADGGELKDYRLYTFDGIVKAINVGSPGYRRRNENIFLDAAWHEIPLSEYQERLPDHRPARPASLPRMIEAAGRLGRGIDFVRIDLFDTTRGVVLGEMTVYPGGGRFCPTSCRRFNNWLGDQWHLDRNGRKGRRPVQ